MVKKNEEKIINPSRNIYQRIQAVMKEVSFVKKETTMVNKQYRFVSHDAVTSALHGPMAENGMVMVPSIDELTQDGNRTTVKMKIEFVNVDNPEDRLVVIHYGYGIDNQDKGIGKAVSYAVKYAMLKTFCLETGDDVEKDSINYKPPSISKEQALQIEKLLNNDDKLKYNILTWLKVTNIFEIPTSMYEKVCTIIKERTEKKDEV